MIDAAVNDIYYKVSGQGPVVVLVHGFLESMTMWKELVTKIESSHRILLVDLPGHGKSPAIGPVCSMEQMALLLYRVLQKEQIAKAHFIGHSMGGYVLLELLSDHPEVFNGLVLLNSSSLSDTPDRIKARKQSLRLLGQNKDRYLELAIKGLFAAEDRGRFSVQINQLITQAQTLSTAGITACVKGMMQRKDHTNTLKNYHGDKIALAGSRDPLIGKDINILWAKQALTPLKFFDCGHMTWLEKPNLNDSIMHFIE